LSAGNNNADGRLRQGNLVLQSGICVVTGATQDLLLARFSSTQLQLHKLQAMMRVLLCLFVARLRAGRSWRD
jgi:hypothetical protein